VLLVLCRVTVSVLGFGGAALMQPVGGRAVDALSAALSETGSAHTGAPGLLVGVVLLPGIGEDADRTALGERCSQRLPVVLSDSQCLLRQLRLPCCLW